MPASIEAERELARLSPEVRLGTDGDSIAGATPRWVVEPADAEAMAAVLAWASLHKEPVVIRGGGTHLGWGRRPSDLGLLVSTRRLTGILRYEPGDLTVSVEAGLTVDALNRELEKHGQWLPFDVPADASTVGGAIATNDSGPLRHRYGTPRDQVIGVRLATADGRVASAGGQVVKNVAGYDLSKLVAGSFGTLAGIVHVTFKLAPIPRATTTLRLAFDTEGALGRAAAAISASQLDPMCVEVTLRTGQSMSCHLLMRFGGTSTSNAEQASAAAAIAAGSSPSSTEFLEGDDRPFWRERATEGRLDRRTHIRASWLPDALPAVLTLLVQAAKDTGVEMSCHARATVGAGDIFVAGEPASRMSAVARLRERTDLCGHVVVAHAGADVTNPVDAWGAPLPSAIIAGALKRTLDPAGVLNAGRGPI
jgi:glycolate oxidase FAD binding subunit